MSITITPDAQQRYKATMVDIDKNVDILNSYGAQTDKKYAAMNLVQLYANIKNDPQLRELYKVESDLKDESDEQMVIHLKEIAEHYHHMSGAESNLYG